MKLQKKQVLHIHGGTTWPNREALRAYLATYSVERIVEKMRRQGTSWRDTLPVALGDAYEVLLPQMPVAQYARYEEWALWFKKLIPLLRNDVVLIGHSLGGVFLAKYLTEHVLPVRVAQLHLVAAPIEDTPNEPLCDFGIEDPQELVVIEQRVHSIMIYHSEDDAVVPFKDGVAYAHYLPNAAFVRFIDRGHFLQEDFPELIASIKDV